MPNSSDVLFGPLRVSTLRRKVIHYLYQRHFEDLNIQVPLGRGCVAPVSRQDYWHSFTEIFILNEYDFLDNELLLPNRWLDLGCHAGFFSLYVEWKRRLLGVTKRPSALLVDGDQRTETQIALLAAANELRSEFQFLHGAISSSQGPLEFVERSCMASGVADFRKEQAGRVRLVPVVTPREILETFPPPYDLIKVDIEGAEFALFRSYEPILANTTNVLLEWHAWHDGGGGLSQIEAMAADLGFSKQTACTTGSRNFLIGPELKSGLLLLQRS